MLTVLLLVALSYFAISENEKYIKEKLLKRIRLGVLLPYGLGVGGVLLLFCPDPWEGSWAFRAQHSACRAVRHVIRKNKFDSTVGVSFTSAFYSTAFASRT